MRITLHALAAIALAAPLAVSAAAQSTVTPDLVAKVQAHRAIYSLKARTVATDGNVSDANGAIAYELAEECDRWLTKHTFVLKVVRHDAKERTIRTDYTSWETKDGKSFGFETRTKTDGTESEAKKGTASLERPGAPGKATIDTGTQKREIVLPAGTDFPTRHILELLAAARAGEKIVWRHMFDGSSDGKVNGVHAVVIGAVPAGTVEPAALFAHPGIRLKLSFFDPPGEDKDRPSYKVDMTVNDVGVTTAMILEYSDFSLESAIEKIETLPKPTCR